MQRYIIDYLRDNADRHPDKTAVDFEGEKISWRRLWQLTEAKSGYFANELGARRQRIVALLLTNSIDFITTYLAVLNAGHIVMPLDPAFKKLELDAIVNQIKPAIIVTSRRYLAQIDEHFNIILVDDIPEISIDADYLRLGADKQIASLTFTSGTSGRPKAVPNTHANHMWNIKVCSQVWQWTEKDRLLLCLPLSHWYGLVMGLSGVIYHGGTLYLRQQSFAAEAVLEDLSSGKITMFTHIPLGYAKLLTTKAGNHDLTGVRVCISGSAPLSPAVWRSFKDRFGVEIIETYGSSETGRIAGNHLDKKVIGSPGPALPDVVVKLSAENELLVKSPGLFPGYYMNYQATKKSTTAEGFWRTGDIAEIKNGNIFLKGRVQERIRRFSYTISPRDVEWALLQNPKIKDVFVMGRQRSEEANDELIYFVVSSLSNDEIVAYCKANLLFAWRPDRIIRLESLPRTRTGKASLPKLREFAEQIS